MFFVINDISVRINFVGNPLVASLKLSHVGTD